MLHPDQVSDTNTITFEDRQKAYEALQTGIARSNRIPYRQIGLLLGLIQTGLLTLAATTMRARGVRRNAVSRALGAQYFHVPEMAIHKKIELDAFLAETYEGEGVDFGCGGGEVGGILIGQKGLRLHGIDQSELFADQVRNNGYTGFHAADIADVPLPDGRFDYVISICVLEHVRDINAALAEARRLLKPGGKLVFSTPQPAFSDSLVGVRWRRLLGREASARSFADRINARSMHETLLDAEGWSGLLAPHGLQLERAEPLFSRGQHAFYDLLNWDVYFPRVYTADKLYRLMCRWRSLRRVGSWAAGTVGEAVSRRPVTAEDATHMFCVARAVDRPNDPTSVEEREVT